MCCYWVRLFFFFFTSFHSFIVLAIFVRKPQPSEYQACKIHGYMRCVLNVHRKDVNHLCIEKRAKIPNRVMSRLDSLSLDSVRMSMVFGCNAIFPFSGCGDEEARLQLYTNIMTDENDVCVCVWLCIIFTHVYSLSYSLALVWHFFAPSMR